MIAGTSRARVPDSYVREILLKPHELAKESQHLRLFCFVQRKGERQNAVTSRVCGCHFGSSRFDVFGGSGSTLIACEQLNRKCYMMELSPKYVDVIIKRWEEYTGKKAVKIA